MEEDRRLPGWVLPLVGVLAVVALVVVGLNRSPDQFDPASPEGTVQSYIAALVAGDFETAATFWAEDDCLPASIEPTEGAPDISATLVSVDGDETEATVVIGITDNTSDPLNGVAEYQEWFTLVRGDTGWKIRQPSWPYYDQICEASA
ncbi:MAG TPA: hypothetical protein VFU96_01440 [Acidimicrobiia bacterium]|nr:hypothetical protein [Acidimicrobiia bacterium]